VFAGEQTTRAVLDRLHDVSNSTARHGASTMTTCLHRPACPPADRPDRDAARVISTHPRQGWSLLCNGVILFDDLGELLPDRRTGTQQYATAAA
jgi:hypothetical protein